MALVLALLLCLVVTARAVADAGESPVAELHRDRRAPPRRLETGLAADRLGLDVVLEPRRDDGVVDVVADLEHRLCRCSAIASSLPSRRLVGVWCGSRPLYAGPLPPSETRLEPEPALEIGDGTPPPAALP